MNEFVASGGEILNPEGYLAGAEAAEASAAVERLHADAALFGNLAEREGHEPGIDGFVAGRHRLAVGLPQAEHRHGPEADRYQSLLVIFHHLSSDGREYVNGLLALADVAVHLLPLTVAAGFAVAMESDDELVAPGPGCTGHRVASADEDGGEGFR